MIYAYARLEENQVVEYPIYEGDLKVRAGFDDSSGLKFYPPEGYVGIEDVPMPQVELRYDQKLVDDTPQIVDGTWTRVWAVKPLTSDELDFITARKSLEVREERNLLLFGTDWTQLADSPVDPQTWREYRQQLRDVPEQTGFPWEVVWPTPPS